MHIHTFMYAVACFHIVIIVFICLTIVIIFLSCFVWICLSIFKVSNQFYMFLMICGTLFDIVCIFLLHAGSLCRQDALHGVCVYGTHMRVHGDRMRSLWTNEAFACVLCVCVRIMYVLATTKTYKKKQKHMKVYKEPQSRTRSLCLHCKSGLTAWGTHHAFQVYVYIHVRDAQHYKKMITKDLKQN